MAKKPTSAGCGEVMAARYDWETIRAEYEAGSSMCQLSKHHGVSKQAISKRAMKEGWLQDSTEAINRLAQAKVDGLVDTVNPKKKAEALAKAADAKAAVIARHKEEWDKHQKLIEEALAAEDNTGFEKAKLAKITAETIKIRQEGERKAWGIQEVVTPAAQGGNATVKIDLSRMEPEKLAELVDMTEERAQRFFANEQH